MSPLILFFLLSSDKPFIQYVTESPLSVYTIWFDRQLFSGDVSEFASYPICTFKIWRVQAVRQTMPLRPTFPASKKPDTLNQCWVNAGPPSMTLAQH